MAWKSGSFSPVWKSGSTEYEPHTGSFEIVSYPSLVQRGSTFSLVCEDVSSAPTASLAGHPITVNSFTSTSIDLSVPESHGGKHGTKPLAVTVDDVTRVVMLSYNPPAGWSYVDFVNPTNDPEVGALVNLLDENGDPVNLETGDQAVYQNTVSDGSSGTWPVVIDSENYIAVNTGGQPLVGSAIDYFIITDEGRGATGSLQLSPLHYNNGPVQVEPIEPKVVQAGNSLSFSLIPYFVDPDGDILVFTKISGPSTVNISSSGFVTGTPTTDGNFTVVFSVSDDRGSAPLNASFSLVVTPEGVINPVVRFTEPLTYFNTQGVKTVLASTSNIKWAAFSVSSGGVHNGTRLASGTVATDEDGMLPDLVDPSFYVGLQVEIALYIGTRSLVIPLTVVDGG